MREISVTTDRLCIRRITDGRPIKSLRFSAEDLPALERAIDAVKHSLERVRNVESVALKYGAHIELGVGRGALFLRIVEADGDTHDAVRLEGDELVALARAVKFAREHFANCLEET